MLLFLSLFLNPFCFSFFPVDWQARVEYWGTKKFLLSYKKVNWGGWVKISKCVWVCERVCVSACVRVRACVCKRESENVGWISVCVDIWSRKSASSFEAQSVTELKSFRKSSFAILTMHNFVFGHVSNFYFSQGTPSPLLITNSALITMLKTHVWL